MRLVLSLALCLGTASAYAAEGPAIGTTSATGSAAPPPPSSCLIQPDKKVPVTPGPGRVVACGLDLGSRSAKLSVVSMEAGRNATVEDERVCKRTLGMGALVFDPKAGVARPLPPEAIAALVDTVREFKEICARDGGSIVAAGATQWARDAPNVAEVAAAVKAATGVAFDVLSPRQEAEYSYMAASVNTPGRLVLDAGSNSFELAWQEEGSSAIGSITVPYGYVRGATLDFQDAPDYAAGLAVYQSHARARIEEELARLSPPLRLASLRDRIGRGRLGRDLIALGEDGAIVPLAVQARLRPHGGWIADQKRYDEALGGEPRRYDPSFGTMIAPPLRGSEVAAYLRALGPADFTTLKSDPVRALYGQKALVVPALVDLLLRELGARRLVVVPQEATIGHILSKAAMAASGPPR